MCAPTRFFAERGASAYDFGAMTRHAYWLLLAIGCASPISTLRDDNRRLTQTVAELRGERRAQDRKLRDLQHQLDKLRADSVQATLGPMPSLPVEVAAPPGGSGTASGTSNGTPYRVVGVTDDGTEIVYEGEAATAKSVVIDEDTAPRRTRPRAIDPAPGVVEVASGGVIEAASGDRLEVTRRVPPVSARAARVPTRERDATPERADDASGEYRAAVELVRAGNHGDAIVSLRNFLKKHPRHDYADNAQYWLGEAYYAQKDYPHALTEFRTVIETYPRGNKVPDALLKVGYCYHALGQSEKARAVLEQVVNLYPKTEPAALAAKRLETP